MPVPKKPVYTPEQLIKKGLFTAGKLLMMLFMKGLFILIMLNPNYVI